MNALMFRIHPLTQKLESSCTAVYHAVQGGSNF